MTAPDPQSAPPAQILREYYHLHFAGRPRVTRNLELLGQLITLAEQGGHTSLAALWRREQTAIAQEQEAAQDVGRRIARSVEAGQIALHRARRFELDALRTDILAIDCVGTTAAMGDLRLADAELGDVDAAAAQAAPQVAAMRAQLQHAQAACAALVDRAQSARREGPPGRRAQVGVRAAQLLLHAFASRIADRDVTIVRPERISQLAQGLTRVVDDLRAIEMHDPAHLENCTALAQQAAMWRQEGQRAAALRRQHSPDELAHALGLASDEVLAGGETWPDIMAPYSAQMAAGLALCDRIDELQRQLTPMPLIFGLAHHQHTLGTVTDAWAYLTAQLDRHVQAAQAMPQPAA